MIASVLSHKGLSKHCSCVTWTFDHLAISPGMLDPSPWAYSCITTQLHLNGKGKAYMPCFYFCHCCFDFTIALRPGSKKSKHEQATSSTQHKLYWWWTSQWMWCNLLWKRKRAVCSVTVYPLSTTSVHSWETGTYIIQLVHFAIGGWVVGCHGYAPYTIFTMWQSHIIYHYHDIRAIIFWGSATIMINVNQVAGLPKIIVSRNIA